MPSRQDFLDNILSPSTTSFLPTDTCPICISPYTHPVQTPCGHDFCEVCIRKWLTMEARNTCPLCKTAFFPLDTLEEREAAVIMALQASGLMRFGFTWNGEIETYGSDLFTSSDMQRGMARAVFFLARVESLRENLGNPGRTLIDVMQLSGSFVAMGNLIQEFATTEGRGFSAEEAAEWKLVLSQLWVVLRENSEMQHDSLAFAGELRTKVLARLRSHYSDTDCIRFFYGPRSDKLNVMLLFLTFVCRLAYEHERQDREGGIARRLARRLRDHTGRCAVM